VGFCPVLNLRFFAKPGLTKLKIGQDSTLPTPCPSRLKELITVANLEQDSDARKHLQAIARAFRAKRQATARPASIEFVLSQTVTISVQEGRVDTASHELILALNQIDPPENIGLIRECPKCLELFWAGRKDKEACTRHADALRKRETRLWAKKKAEERAKRQASRKKAQVKKPLEISRTTEAIIHAIMNQCRVFSSIDSEVYLELNRRGGRERGSLYRTATVIRCLKMLVDRGYLTHHPQDDPKKDRYAPTEKLKPLYKQILSIKEDRRQAFLATYFPDRK